METKDPLVLYVVYDHPSDYPDWYVVRREFVLLGGWVMKDPRLFMQEKELETIHVNLKRRGLYWLPRNPTDDPVIVGSYI